MMLSARNRSPFTVSQWQELEHQALIFKYMVSGVPIPPDLIYTVKRSLDSSMSGTLFPHQTVGWGCFQVGFGRKADPEPGRCRRTDGKKWRCSKEAFPDSKYCERHMHRGKNRSRKPVEVFNTTTTNPSPSPPPISSITINPSTTTSSSSSYSPYSISSSMASDQLTPHHSYHNTPLYPFLYPHSSSSRTPGSGLLSPQNNTSHHLFLDSASYSQADKDYRYFHGMREGVDERSFFPEASGTVRGRSESYTPLTMSNSSSGYSQSHFQGLADSSKQQQQQQQQQEQHCFVLGTDFKSVRSIKAERDDDESQKPLHHFFSEWPQKNRDTWLDLEDDPSTHSSFSTTQLSISLPMSSHELLSSNPRIRTDG